MTTNAEIEVGTASVIVAAGKAQAAQDEASRVLRKPGPKPRLPTVAERNPLTTSNTRTFKLVRVQDETGISGTGVVAEGIEFTNGWCALSWLTAMHSVAVYPNVRAVQAIHGHNNRTRVVFDDGQTL